MSKTTNRLGRGLSTLIPHSQTLEYHATPPSADDSRPLQIRQIPVSSLIPNPRQPRTNFQEAGLAELAQSIKRDGLLQPVIVRPKDTETFEVIAGERRWRAAKLAGLETIPCIVRAFTDAEALEAALIENLHRADLAPLERAAGYKRYLDTFGGTIDDLAQRLSESRANISNYLRLLNLQPEVCYLLGSGELGMGQARALAGITDPQRQLALARLAARRRMSVRQVEALVRQSSDHEIARSSGGDSRSSLPIRRHFQAVEEAFSKSLGLRVRLLPGRKKNSGRIVIFYSSLDEFDLVAERLGSRIHLE